MAPRIGLSKVQEKIATTVEIWLAYKQYPASVSVTYTDDKLVDITGKDSLPKYIMTDMQSYFISISVFRCRCLGLCKYCVKQEDEGTIFSGSGVCKHYSGFARNVLHQFKNTGTGIFSFICIVPEEGDK